MRRSLTFAAVWVAAAAVATTAAWQGVGLVTSEVTDNRPGSLTAAGVEAELGELAERTGGTGGTGGPVTTPTTAPGEPTTPTTPTTSAPTTTAPGETRTYTSTGGSAVLRFSPAGVVVVSSVPNPGFGVEIEPEHGNGVRVEFESDGHRSRIDGWWDGGPRDRVREDPH
ncbi:MAG TPA: hypothetical protein VIL36_14860 [Acidimicrobiales bacterium]